MTISDNIADFITRIRNAYIAGNETLRVAATKKNKVFLSIMKNEGFITDFTPEKIDNFDYYKIILNYISGIPALREITRVSKPSKRVYKAIKNLNKCYNGFGMYILSTSKGILVDYEARRLNVGGEVLFYVF